MFLAKRKKNYVPKAHDEIKSVRTEGRQQIGRTQIAPNTNTQTMPEMPLHLFFLCTEKNYEFLLPHTF